MKTRLIWKVSTFFVTVLLLAGVSGMVFAAKEELMLTDTMKNFSKMHSYAKNLVYNDFTKADDVNFSKDRLGKNAIMKFSGGPDDSWITYECAGATKIVMEASIVNGTGNPYYPNHMKFFTSTDDDTWKPIESKKDVREYPAKWTDVTYTVTNIPADAKYFKILLWVPDELPAYASRIYNMEMYGVKPVEVSSQEPVSSAASSAATSVIESTLPTSSVSSNTVTSISDASEISSQAAGGEVDGDNLTVLVIGIIAGVVVTAGAAVAIFFFVLKKKMKN